MHWTSEGWDFLLEDEKYNELAIGTLSKILDIYKRVEFRYKGLYYEIFDSIDGGYIVNVSSSDEKDDDDCYLEKHIVDGGLCTGNVRDAIEFML